MTERSLDDALLYYGELMQSHGATPYREYDEEAGDVLAEIRQRLEAMERQRQNALSAMRMACIALAHAACKDPTYDAEYKKLSDAIAAMAKGE